MLDRVGGTCTRSTRERGDARGIAPAHGRSARGHARSVGARTLRRGAVALGIRGGTPRALPPRTRACRRRVRAGRRDSTRGFRVKRGDGPGGRGPHGRRLWRAAGRAARTRRERGLPDDALVDGLFTAAALGAVMAARTSLSGAAAGCQAEVGAAAAMAAGAATELLGGIAGAVGACSFARAAGLDGTVCDPVGGLVEVHASRETRPRWVSRSPPRRWRLPVSSSRFPSTRSRMLSRVRPRTTATLRETAQGGLAVTPAAEALTRWGRRARANGRPTPLWWES